MLPFGSGDGRGQFWTPESVSDDNSDWVGTTTAPLFNSPFYAIDQQGHLNSQDVNSTSAGVAAALRAAAPSEVVSAADNSWFYQNFQAGNHTPSNWQWPSVCAPSTHDALNSPTSHLNASWLDQTNAGPLLGSASDVTGEGLGDTQHQVDFRNFSSQQAYQSRPDSRITGSSSPPVSVASATRLTAPTPAAPISQTPPRSQPRSSDPKTTSPTKRRTRESSLKSPAAKQTPARTPIQPNEEEQARRIHMAAYTRGTSLVSDTSTQSREAAGERSARVDRGFGPAGSAMAQNVGAGKAQGVMRTPNPSQGASDEYTLPLGKGFPIQIGSELFRLSGASIMSDSPSYFSRFFEKQLRQSEDPNGGVKTLYIDRDPTTFQDICRHLQGYVIQPTDGSHYVRLFADAQFYGLPRLISQLFESETVVQIGGENFTVPRDIFSNLGDTPNFFSLGFAVFFSTPNGVYPGLHSAGLLRPPPVKPPTVPNRSARVFAEILHLLRGYPLTIRDENHRAELLRDCKYFNLKGLEQKLIVHSISYNASTSVSEIVIRLEDVRQSGISYVASPSASDPLSTAGWVHYARPYVDEEAYELILEIGDEACKLDLSYMRAEFYGLMKARISKLFQVIANKMGMPVNAPLGLLMAEGGAASGEASPGSTGLSEDKVKIRIGADAFIILDGDEYVMDGHGFEAFEVDEDMQESPTVETSRMPASAPSSVPSNRSTPALGFARPISRQGQGSGLSISAPRPVSTASTAQQPPRKRKRDSLDDFGEWIIRRGQWRLRVQPRLDNGRRGFGSVTMTSGSAGGSGGDGNGMEIVMHAVKLDAVSGQRGRNMMRSFLGTGG